MTIGDYTVMEEDSFVMAHTVEDRRLKFLGELWLNPCTAAH